MINQPQRPNIPKQPPNNATKFSLSWVYAIIFMALMFLFIKNPSEEGATRKISYSEFKEYVSNGYIEKVVAYDDNKVEVTAGLEAFDVED